MFAAELDSEFGVEKGCNIGVGDGEYGREGFGGVVWVTSSVGTGDCGGVKVVAGVGVIDGVDVGCGVGVGDVECDGV